MGYLREECCMKNLFSMLLAAFLLASCSDVGPEGTPRTTDAERASSAPEATGTEPVEAAGSGPEHRAFCEEYATFDRLLDELPDGTVEEMRASVGTLAEQSTVLADGAPAEVAEGAEATAAYFADLIDVVAEASTKEEAEEVAMSLDSFAGLQEAGQALMAWTEENCPQ